MPIPEKNKPLVITDCDEVLLRMVHHFRAWLKEDHAITMTVSRDFSGALAHDDGRTLEQEEVWELLGGFFDLGGSCGQQDPIERALTRCQAGDDGALLDLLSSNPP